jgi:hypothetical protein
MGSRAEAQTQWREYAWATAQFAVSFPAPPSVVRMPSDPADTHIRGTVYFVDQPTGRFEVVVFDLRLSGISEPVAIGRAVAVLRKKGTIDLDIASEVQGHWGHFLSFETRDGGHTIAAVYFRNERLYEIEATAPAASFDVVSSEMVRFQQSLRFTGNLNAPRSDLAIGPLPGPLLNLGGRLFAPH